MPDNPLDEFITTIQGFTLNGTAWEGVQTISPQPITYAPEPVQTYNATYTAPPLATSWATWANVATTSVSPGDPLTFEWPAPTGCFENSCPKLDAEQKDGEYHEVDIDELMSAIFDEQGGN